MAPKVSIIIPVYNVAEYLRECLNSIKNQTFTDWECICVDDGSKDASGQILDAYLATDSRFVVRHKANGGVTSARKMGVELSCGEFLIFVDSDDILPADSLETLLSLQKKHAADLVRANWSRLSEGTLTPHALPALPAEVVAGIDLLPACYYYGALYGTLYKRELFSERCPFPSEKIIYGEDSLTFFEVLLRANRALFVKDVVYYYRNNPESITNYFNKNPDKQFAAITDYSIAIIEFINRHRTKKLICLKYLVVDNLSNWIVKTKYFRQHKFSLLSIYLRYFVFSLPVQVMVWKSNWKLWVKLWLFSGKFFIHN